MLCQNSGSIIGQMQEKLSWLFFNWAWNKHFLECKLEHWGLIECVLFFHSDTSYALKASLDSVLCHSRDQAEKTYNRQTASQSKESAVHVARECAQEIISNPAMTKTMHNSTVCVQLPVTMNIKLTLFVELIEGSTLRSSKILFGQVHSFVDHGNVSLLQNKAPKNFLKRKLDGEQWIEDVNCLVPMSMTLVRNKPGLSRLNNRFQSIHKSVSSRCKLIPSLNFKLHCF